jgi:hypothetical protein
MVEAGLHVTYLSLERFADIYLFDVGVKPSCCSPSILTLIRGLFIQVVRLKKTPLPILNSSCRHWHFPRGVSASLFP